MANVSYEALKDALVTKLFNRSCHTSYLASHIRLMAFLQLGVSLLKKTPAVWGSGYLFIWEPGFGASGDLPEGLSRLYGIQRIESECEEIPYWLIKFSTLDISRLKASAKR
jgi:hypothetical protein